MEKVTTELRLMKFAMCNGDKLHNAGFNGSEVYIACIDAGFHNINDLPALRMVVKGLVATYDFVEGNDTVFDDDDHGLEVLSCMAAYEPGKMVEQLRMPVIYCFVRKMQPPSFLLRKLTGFVLLNLPIVQE